MGWYSEPFWVRFPYTLTGTGTVKQVGKLVKQLGTDIGLPQRLRDIGVKKDQIPKFVDILFTTSAARVKANTPPLSREDATMIYESIW